MMKDAEYDDVNNPAHYKGVVALIPPSAITRELPGPLSNAVKYVWRAGAKGGAANGVKDLEKALWYLSDWQDNGYPVDMRTARAIWRLIPCGAFGGTRYMALDYILGENWFHAERVINELMQGIREGADV